MGRLLRVLLTMDPLVPPGLDLPGLDPTHPVLRDLLHRDPRDLDLLPWTSGSWTCRTWTSGPWALRAGPPGPGPAAPGPPAPGPGPYAPGPPGPGPGPYGPGPGPYAPGPYGPAPYGPGPYGYTPYVHTPYAYNPYQMGGPQMVTTEIQPDYGKKYVLSPKVDKTPELVLYVGTGDNSGGPGMVYEVKGQDGQVLGKQRMEKTVTGLDMYRDHGVVAAMPRRREDRGN